jgi:Holliday junction resolvase-like predicted endonuclease
MTQLLTAAEESTRTREADSVTLRQFESHGRKNVGVVTCLPILQNESETNRFVTWALWPGPRSAIDPSMLWRVTQLTVRVLDRIADRVLGNDERAAHQRTGRRGEIDLIGRDGDVLCFIEVKTRTTRNVKRAEAAVNHDKTVRASRCRSRISAPAAFRSELALRRDPCLLRKCGEGSHF